MPFDLDVLSKMLLQRYIFLRFFLDDQCLFPSDKNGTIFPLFALKASIAARITFVLRYSLNPRGKLEFSKKEIYAD